MLLGAGDEEKTTDDEDGDPAFVEIETVTLGTIELDNEFRVELGESATDGGERTTEDEVEGFTIEAGVEELLGTTAKSDWELGLEGVEKVTSELP
jgi:hypothetical protein